MIKTLAHPTVAEVFSINHNTVYRIPKYQREYAWGISDWDALFKDIMENDQGYFLGSYICVSSSALEGSVLEVIDGQQRFTTLQLLMTALYSKLASNVDENDTEDMNVLANLRKKLANHKQSFSAGKKRSEYFQRLYLQKQNMNDEDFAYILYTNGVITDVKTKPINFGNRRIAKAFRHLCKLIDSETARRTQENPDFPLVYVLLELVEKVESAVMVGIEVDSNRDAYMLFESLNHRGVPLSALDLIKNTLIAHAERNGNTDNCYEQWKYMLGLIGQDDYAVQERFFRQYYNAFRDELNEPYQTSEKRYYFGYLATRSTLLDIYEELIKMDYQSLLDDLAEKAEKYAVIVNNSDETHVYSEVLLDLSRISGAPSYMLLLYLLSNQERMELPDSDICEVVSILIRFFVRRNITDVPNTRKLTQIFMEIIAEVRNMSGDAIVSCIHERLRSVSATDEMFEEKLRGPLYDENPEATRFVLCSIEAQHQTRETYTNLWSRDRENGKKYVWTIEHIFPEGENIPTSWVDMIANGDADLAKRYRDEYVHTLGNLTITGYNQNLSNMPFAQKRDRTAKDRSKQIGYRNGLYLNADVVVRDRWTVEDITRRTDVLVAELMHMFEL